ncbi:MAG TPA: A24 family peptidase [Polyangiaceae bacterium]|nr:A24 family peptidase [Polyangiaceae bacterium]
MNPAVVFHSSALIVALVAATMDARTGRIPNALTIPAALVAVLMHVPMGVAGIGLSVAGCTLAALLPWSMHRVTRGAAIGGGDVKLFAALGALCGPAMGLEIELSAFVLVAVFAMVRLAFVGRLLRMLGNVACLVVNPFLPAKYRRPMDAEAFTAMRMGPAIFVGLACVLVRNGVLGWVPWLAR